MKIIIKKKIKIKKTVIKIMVEVFFLQVLRMSKELQKAELEIKEVITMTNKLKLRKVSEQA